PRASSASSCSTVTFSMRCLASATSWPIVFFGVNMASPPLPVYPRAPARSRGPRSGPPAHQRELHPVEEPAVESHPAGEEQDEQAGAVGGMEPAEHFQRRGGEEARDGPPPQGRAQGPPPPPRSPPP